MALRLNSPIWNKARRADVFSKALFEVGNDAVEDIQANIDKSRPAGKVYRRGAITRKATTHNAVKGLRMTEKNGVKHRIVGAKFHRASAKGQPPARDTSRLYRGNKVKRMAAFRVRVYNDVNYAPHLEPPAKLDRPFFRSVVRANRPKYVEKLQRAKRSLIRRGIA